MSQQPRKYRATGRLEIEWEVEFTEDDILGEGEDRDTPEQAGEEFLLAVPENARGDGDLDVTVEEIG